jgi:septal ring factor EnvC (AmiA/AmiB activator)
MTAHAALRRTLVTVGIAASLLAAGLTIRAASMWAAASAPLTLAPVSVSSVQGALQQERARSATLEAQLAALESSASQLRSALDAAQSQAGVDQATADDLRASLTAAQKKLPKLETSLKAAAARSSAPSGGGSGGGSSGGTGGDDDGGHGDD